MIASCPTCGTRYRIDPPRAATRARCGRCAAGVELSTLRTYRIVGPEAPHAGAPAAAAAIAPASSAALWKDDDPLPAIPEMEREGAFEREATAATGGALLADPLEGLDDDGGEAIEAGTRAVWTPFFLWVAAGAIVGTGTSWTLGGDTVTGIAAGAAAGAVAGWGWTRWTSST